MITRPLTARSPQAIHPTKQSQLRNKLIKDRAKTQSKGEKSYAINLLINRWCTFRVLFTAMTLYPPPEVPGLIHAAEPALHPARTLDGLDDAVLNCDLRFRRRR